MSCLSRLIDTLSPRKIAVAILMSAIGVGFYGFGIVSGLRFEPYGTDVFQVAGLTLLAGLALGVLGWICVVGLGGILSLKLVESVSRLTRARHVVELDIEEPVALHAKVGKEILIILLPLLVFVLAVTLGVDINGLHDPRAGVFHDLLHVLDVFSRSTAAEPVLLVVGMMVLVGLAGFVPSLVLPYFRKFRITGVNSGPFHKDLLFTFVGFFVGISAVLAVVGLVYEAFWVGKGPYYYAYVVPCMLGLSFHFTVGAFLARDRSERMVRKKLQSSEGERVVRGKVRIEGVTG